MDERRYGHPYYHFRTERQVWWSGYWTGHRVARGKFATGIVAGIAIGAILATLLFR